MYFVLYVKITYDWETTGATANDEADFDATAFPPKRGDEAVNAEALAVKRATAITNFILLFYLGFLLYSKMRRNYDRNVCEFRSSKIFAIDVNCRQKMLKFQVYLFCTFVSTFFDLLRKFKKSVARNES